MIDLHSVDEILKEYEKIESQINVIKHVENVTYVAPVNFTESMKIPRHRWYQYKEGFSPVFVENFVEKNFGSSNIGLIDPFSGVGTAPIEVGLNGGKGVGIEISPLAYFIGKVKAIPRSEALSEKLIRQIEDFRASGLSDIALPPNNKTVVSYFEEPYLEAILRVKVYIYNIDNENVRNLFLLALLNSVEVFSTHRKAGNGLKRKTRVGYQGLSGSSLDQVRKYLLEYLMIYETDIRKTPKNPNTLFINGNSLDDNIYNEIGGNYDGLLTSPPYANCFDYSKIYMCELWLGDFFKSKEDQKEFRENSIRSHVHYRWRDRNQGYGSEIVNHLIAPRLSEMKLWSNNIPSMLQGYFNDIGKLLSSFRKLMKPRAPLGIVVGNSAYGGIPIATDLLIANIGEDIGYKIDSIEIYRAIIPSSQQYKAVSNKKYFRESMVLLRNSD